MGCGCNKSRRNTRRTVVPQNAAVRARQTNLTNNNTRLQAQSVSEGMSKEQRDAERQRRIQLIVSQRNIKK